MSLSNDSLSIGELARRTGASVRSLRHYEQSGLLPALRTSAGHRRFSEEAESTVRRIRMFLEAGLPLSVIAKLMPCFTDQGASLEPCVTRYLRQHLATVEDRIESLDQQREALAQLQDLVLA
ncbi:MAG: MerR family transcriptional regulator [Nocardioides sp.]|uniref:MerR family transcriptional regulator n=1 Tax=Nocardioides sp. TaxID=35761 RepID=UPI0039E3D518